MRPLRLVLGISLLAACNSILGNKDFHFVKADGGAGDAGAGPGARCDASACLTGQTCKDGLCVSEPAHETGAGGSQGMSGGASAGSSGENTGGTTSASGGSSGKGTGGSAASANNGGALGNAGATAVGAGGAGAGGGGAGGMGSLPCKTFTLCDGFEGDAPGTGTSRWNVILNGYTVVVDTSQVHSGKKAVHISAPTVPGSGWITDTTTFPAADFWGRAWLRLNAEPYGHQMFIAIVTPTDQFRLLNTIGDDKIRLNEQVGDVFESTMTIPMQTWFCYEWHVTTNSTSVYVDGTQLTYVNNMPPTWSITNAQSLQLGFQRLSSGTSAGEIWIDDVAVNATRVGCQ